MAVIRREGPTNLVPYTAGSGDQFTPNWGQTQNQYLLAGEGSAWDSMVYQKNVGGGPEAPAAS